MFAIYHTHLVSNGVKIELFSGFVTYSVKKIVILVTDYIFRVSFFAFILRISQCTVRI